MHFTLAVDDLAIGACLAQEQLFGQTMEDLAVLSASRVENWRGGGRYRGLTVAGGFRRVPVSQSDP